MDGFFFLAAGGLVGILYFRMASRGDMVGWLLGLGHAGLALIAMAGWLAATDGGFAVSMALLAIYGGAMSAAEVVRRIRRVVPAA
ncbi:MAG: hypothetical protein KF723_14185 [Rhizobiaceae bacterium]|nr:hypothetical protein [Rhizobiaceae bacterium]